MFEMTCVKVADMQSRWTWYITKGLAWVAWAGSLFWRSILDSDNNRELFCLIPAGQFRSAQKTCPDIPYLGVMMGHTV
jgi:hypothetical protein